MVTDLGGKSESLLPAKSRPPYEVVTRSIFKEGDDATVQTLHIFTIDRGAK